MNTVGPRSCYDEGKRAVETLFYEYHQQWGVDTRIARIFNTYGPRMSPSDGRVVSNFVVQALAGDDVTVNGDGTWSILPADISGLNDGPITVTAVETDSSGNPGAPVTATVLHDTHGIDKVLFGMARLRT